jgi:hypothetical protein
MCLKFKRFAKSIKKDNHQYLASSCFKNKIILMMHAGDKKSQNRDIDIARERLDALTLNEER